MSFTLHGKSCTLILFEEPDGELGSLCTLDGVLDFSADGVVFLLPDEGPEAVRIPPHLVELIEPVTDEHRECLDGLASAYCLRAFYNGLLNESPIDLDAVLAKSSGDSAAE
jgi:hypothetical protein